MLSEVEAFLRSSRMRKASSLDVTFITGEATNLPQSLPYARPMLLLRLHQGKPAGHAVHRSDRQSSQAGVPAQIPSLRRIHRPLRRRPPALLGILRQCPQGSGLREAAERMGARQENRFARTTQPALEGPGLKVVPLDAVERG